MTKVGSDCCERAVNASHNADRRQSHLTEWKHNAVVVVSTPLHSSASEVQKSGPRGWMMGLSPMDIGLTDVESRQSTATTGDSAARVWMFDKHHWRDPC